MKEVSIEYAHIYTNSKIGEEQELSLRLLKEIAQDNVSLVVLVDDYSFPDPTFDYDSFTTWLGQHGHQPAIVMRESKIIPLCDQVLSLIRNHDLRHDLLDYITTKKYPCSLFIASWYLLRLGKLKHLSFPKSEYALRLINILPESFRPFEDKAIEIIRSTPHANCSALIDNRYFQGRLIA